MPHTSSVRVAVVQGTPVLCDVARSLQKVADLAGDAARSGAELVVFPEAFVSGYPKGHDFGVRVGVRTEQGREQYRAYFESAIEVPGTEAEALARVARERKVHLVIGVIERDGGTLYCTALLFAPDGRLLGKHRKLMPTAMERVIWGMGDGSTLPVADTPLGRLGAIICWENYMPLLRMAMYARGIELYCAITVDDRDSWLPTVTHIALEGRCFVLSACQYLPRSAVPEGYTTLEHTLLIRGGSCIIGPLGQVLAGPKFGEECILRADLDMNEIPRAKLDFDPVGHYARPDVFRLEVNESPQSSVRFDQRAAP